MRIRLFLVTILALVATLGSFHFAAAAQVKADYRFQNTLVTTGGTAPALTNIGPGSSSFAAESIAGVNTTVLRFPEGNGLVLSQTNGVIPSDRYTIVVLFRFESLTGYRKIVDFKNGTADPGLYSYSGTLNFYSGTTATAATVTPNAFVRVALTRNSAKNVVGYVNGLQQFSFTDSSDLALIDSVNTLRFFVDDTTTSAEHSAGAVAQVQLYDDAMSAGEVAALGGGTVGTAPPTATPTVTPTATAPATGGQGGIFSSTPNGSSSGCPTPGQWVGAYWTGGTLPIADAFRTCSGSDRAWVRRSTQWLGYASDAPAASDAFSTQIGEFAFLHGR